MNVKDLRTWIWSLLEAEEASYGGLPDHLPVKIERIIERGIITYDDAIELRMEDGSRFRVSIMQTHFRPSARERARD